MATTTTRQTTEQKQEMERLRTRHSLYIEYAPKWQSYVDAVEGGTDFAKEENLHQHAREHEDDYKERAERLYYDNILESLIEFFTDFIFAETIRRDGGDDDEWYQDFLLNVDKQGNDIETFMRHVSDDHQMYGMLYVVVDAKPKPEGIITKFDEKRLGLGPYWVMVRPEEIIDWVVDAFGNFKYVKRCQVTDDLINGNVVRIERYTEWYTDQIIVSDIDVTEGEGVLAVQQTFPNPIQEIPVVPIRYKRSKKNPHMGNSFIRDMVLSARQILNLQSLEDEFLYRQCFNILAMEAEESLPFKEQEEGESGTSNALIYPRGAKPPQYIAPSAEPADKFEAVMARIEGQMFRKAAQDMMNELFNGSKRSGFSQSQSFQKTVPRIASRADTLEKAENKLMRLTQKFRKKEWTGQVEYKDRYELTNITDWIVNLTSLFRDLGLESETFMKEEMKKAVALFNGKYKASVLKKINAEIDKINFTSWYKKVGPQPKVTKPSPAAQQKSKQSGTSAEVKAEASRQPSTGATKKLKPRKEQPASQ